MWSLIAVFRGDCDPMVAGNKGFGGCVFRVKGVVTVVVMFVFRVGSLS